MPNGLSRNGNLVASVCPLSHMMLIAGFDPFFVVVKLS